MANWVSWNPDFVHRNPHYTSKTNYKQNNLICINSKIGMLKLRILHTSCVHILLYVLLLLFSFVSMSFEIPQLTILNPQKSYWISRLFFLPQLFAILVAKMEGVAWPLSNVNAPREWLELFAKNVSIFSCVGICQSWFLSTFKEFSRTTLVPGSSDKKRAFHFPLQTIRLLTKSLWWIG